MEAAAGGRINQAGNLGASTADFTAHGEIGNAFVALRIDTVRVGCSGDQQLRIGMHGPLDHLVAWPSFHHLTGVHDHRVFGKVARAGDVVGDEE